MAIIQKLRNNGLLILIVIGGALLIFVATDVLNNVNKNISINAQDEQDVIGEINGEKIKTDVLNERFAESIKQMQQDPENLKKLNNPKTADATWKKMRGEAASQAWQVYQAKAIMSPFFEKSGLKVIEEDLSVIMFSKFAAEFVKNQIYNGQMTPEDAYNRYKQAKNNPQEKQQWAAIFPYVKEQSAANRYFAALKKTRGNSKAERLFDFQATTQNNNGKMVILNYNTIQDKDVKVTDDDIEAYIKRNKSRLKQKDNRDIDYTIIPIIPSAQDSADAATQAASQAKLLAAKSAVDTSDKEGLSEFTKLHQISSDSAELSGYRAVFSSKVGDVVGPFYKNGTWYVFQKVIEKDDTADAFVKVEHILIPFQGQLPNKTNVADSLQARKIAEEVYSKIKGGASFAQTAKDFSADPGSANSGGVYDWKEASTYVPEFKNFAMKNGKGVLGIVKTSLGYHVMRNVESPEKLMVKYREFKFEIVPGATTSKLIGEITSKLKSKCADGSKASFEKATEELKLQLKEKTKITFTDYAIPGVESAALSSSIAQWVLGSERKENETYMQGDGKQQVFVRMATVRKEGVPEVKDVRKLLEPIVRKEKKAALMVEKFNKAMEGSKSAEEIAKKVGGGGSVATFTNLTLSSRFVPALNGQEANILGVICGIPEKVWSQPIAGTNFVVAVYVENRTKVEQKVDLPPSQDQFEMILGNSQYAGQYMSQYFAEILNFKDYTYKMDWK